MSTRAVAPLGSVRWWPKVSPSGIVLAFTVVVGAALRVAGLDQALFGDELYSHAVVHGAAFSDLHGRIVSYENTPPLYYAAAWAASHLGDDTVWLRAPSLIAGVAAIPLAFALGRRVAGETAGALAAAFVALNPMLVYFSIEARAYMFAVALTLAATLLLLRALRTREWVAWALCALASCAALYAHIITAPVLIAAFVWAVVAHRDQWKPVVIAGAAAAVGFAPWIPSFVDQGRGAGQIKIKELSLLAPMDLGNLWQQPAHVIGGIPFAPFSSVPGWWAYFLLAGLIAAAAILGIALRSSRPAPLDRRVLALAAACAAAPLIAGLAYGAVTPYSIWTSRNLIILAPFVLVLAAAGLASGPRWALAPVTLLVLVPYAVADSQQLTSQARPDQRSAARFIDAVARPGDVIVLSPLLNTPGPLRDDLRIYLGDRRSIIATPTPSGPALPGGPGSWPASQRIIVTGAAADGVTIVPAVPGRKLLQERSWPGSYTVLVRVYGPGRPAR